MPFRPFVVLFLFASLVSVPTYSSGFGVVQYDAKRVNAPFQGAVAEVLVKPGQEVRKGQPVVLLNSDNETAELALAQTEYNNAKTQFLNDRNDDAAKKAVTRLTCSQGRRRRIEKAAVDSARSSGLTPTIFCMSAVATSSMA